MNTDLNRIRHILLRDWDPLRVGDNPNLADEYDNYLVGIADMIRSGCTADKLADHLKWLEREYMGGELLEELDEPRNRAVLALLGSSETEQGSD